MKSTSSRKDLEKLASKLASLFGEPDASYVAPALDEPPPKGVPRADLAREFHFAMVDVYHRASRELGYNATRFAQMLGSRGGVETAICLIRAENPSDGYMTLWEHHRLDLSVEFVACSTRFRSLFGDQDLARARRRLKDWGLDPDDYF